ncbi:MAG: universal stress protein [Desulfobacteraceae bacterium]|nr:MAG: universal stress protein [Desulfobacteraceae bacterium]
MKIKKILFVTKFEELCYDALSSLLTLTRASLEHVVFLNVIERDKVAMHRGSGYSKEEAVKLKETANIRFIDWAENLFEMGLEVGAYMEVGELIPEILKAVEKESPDLVVIGRSHKGPLEQLYSRSDVTELTRRMSIPILVFKHMTEDNIVPEKIFERPLLATTWSEASLSAQSYLSDMKEVIKEVHVMHVISEKELKKSSTHEVQKARREQRKKLDDLCDELEETGLKARAHVYVGDPAKEIEKAAREYQASLVILGGTGKSALMERWMGSIPQSIADKSVFPCLLIPASNS